MTGKLSKEEAAELLAKHKAVVSALRAVLLGTSGFDDTLSALELLGNEAVAFERRLAELTEG